MSHQFPARSNVSFAIPFVRRVSAFLALLLSPISFAQEGGWVQLLDTELSNFDSFIGVPHYTVDLEGYEKGDGKKGTPIGLNSDPTKVFSVQLEGETPVLKVSGEIYGGLSTKEAYGNYHFRTQFRWGEKRFEPRLEIVRDSGILYHCTGEHGAFWNVWMRSQEMQVQEDDMGDYYAIAGVAADIRCRDSEELDIRGMKAQIYDPTVALRPVGNLLGVKGRCRRSSSEDFERGEWNQLELVCFGGTSIHIVNGKVVMVLENSRKVLNRESGLTEALVAGKIQLQSEGAECYYRNVEIRPIGALPAGLVSVALTSSERSDVSDFFSQGR